MGGTWQLFDGSALFFSHISKPDREATLTDLSQSGEIGYEAQIAVYRERDMNKKNLSKKLRDQISLRTQPIGPKHSNQMSCRKVRPAKQIPTETLRPLAVTGSFFKLTIVDHPTLPVSVSHHSFNFQTVLDPFEVFDAPFRAGRSTVPFFLWATGGHFDSLLADSIAGAQDLASRRSRRSCIALF